MYRYPLTIPGPKSCASTDPASAGAFAVLLRACRCRLEPRADTNRNLFGFADGRRWVWNACVAWAAEAELATRSAGARRAPESAFSLACLSRLLDQWAAENPWLKRAPKQLLQQSLHDFIKARRAFLTGAVPRPPRFQKARDAIPTMRFPQHARLNQDAVFLPKLGWIKYRNSFNGGRGVPSGELRSATVKFEDGHWFVSLLLQQAKPAAAAAPLAALGIDYGVKNTLALSSRVVLQAPLMTDAEEYRILFLERRVVRCAADSNRRALAQRRLNRFRSRISRRIHDWRHKTTTTLSKNHGLIAVEALALQNMTASARGTVEAPGTNAARKAGLNRALLEPGFGIIRQQIAYKQATRGHAFIQVNPAHTSQTCPECGHIHADNRPDRDHFRCVCCGHADDADFAGARNVLRRAQLQSLQSLAELPETVLAAGHGRDCAPAAKAARAHRGSHPRTNPLLTPRGGSKGNPGPEGPGGCQNHQGETPFDPENPADMLVRAMVIADAAETSS
ncbi:MAG: transposase [Opitutaceae bacterium]|nr:transposase [Opitutaceae bacterium]